MRDEHVARARRRGRPTPAPVGTSCSRTIARLGRRGACAGSAPRAAPRRSGPPRRSAPVSVGGDGLARRRSSSWSAADRYSAPTIAREHEADERAAREARAARGAAPPVALAPGRPADRVQLARLQRVVAELVLLDQQLGVEPERLGVRAQEAAHVGGPGQEVPLLVLERTEVLGADLRPHLHVRDVDALAHARLTQGGPDLRHVRGETLLGGRGSASRAAGR